MLSKYIKKESPTSLSIHRVMRGVIWVFSQRIADQGFRFIKTIILARILAPTDFGLMGVAFLAISTLDAFSQTGLKSALIQRKENTDNYLDSSWTVSILRGIVVFVILYIASPYIAVFFENQTVTPIMRILGVSFLLDGLTNVGVLYFRKELEFNREFIFQSSGTLADFTISITSAFILRSVWALIFGALAWSMVRFIMSYVLHPYRPKLSFDSKKASRAL